MRFRKEVLVEGRHKSPVLGEFAVNRSDLEHVAKSFQQLQRAGYDPDYQLEHGKDTAKLGRVVGLKTGRNTNGLHTLVADVEIDDQRQAQRFTTGPWDVSVAIGPVKHGGKSREWVLQHLAATRHPVVKGLGPWQPVADHQATGQTAGPRSQQPQPGQPQAQQQGRQQIQPAAVAAGAGVANKSTLPAKSPLVKDAEARFLRAVAKKGSWHHRKVEREIGRFKKMMARQSKPRMVRHPTL